MAGARVLLLAGGRASRFGSDKLLAPVNRAGNARPMAEHAARNAIEGAGGALAVIPPNAAALRAVLERAGCQIVESARTARGLGASIAAGVAHAADAQGWIVALADMPFIAPGTFAAVSAALGKGASIAAPVSPSGERGHPVGFSRALQAELLALDGDQGARVILQRHAGDIVALEVDDPAILFDIDTPQDLTRIP